MRTAITTCSPRIILCWCLLGLLWGSASCDNDKLHVRLNIAEIPAAAQRLEVHALISGKRTSSHARVDLGAIAPASLRVGVMLSQELGLADFLSPRDSVRISVGAFGAEDRLLSTGDMFDPRPSIGSSLDGSVALRPVGQLASSKQGAAVLAAANPQEISGFSTVPGTRCAFRRNGPRVPVELDRAFRSKWTGDSGAIGPGSSMSERSDGVRSVLG